MSTDEANDFILDHLAKWRKITREYLLAPMESSGASSGPGAVSLLPDGNDMSFGGCCVSLPFNNAQRRPASGNYSASHLKTAR
jgi:hypothetical protein